MPQFDRIHFLTQIFWISLSLIGIYFLIIRFYLSFYFVPGKIRKKLILLKEKSIINLYLTLETSYSNESNCTNYPYTQEDYSKNFFEDYSKNFFEDYSKDVFEDYSKDVFKDYSKYVFKYEYDYIYKYHCQHIGACKCNKRVSGDCDLI